MATAPEQPQITPAKPAKKRPLLPWIIGIIFGLAVGIVGGYLLFTLITPKQTEQNTNTNTDTTGQTTTPQPEDVTKKIKDTYAASYTLLEIDQNNQPEEKELSVRLQQASPAYKVDGYDFYTSYDGGSTLDLLPHDVTASNDIPTPESVAIRKKIVDIYLELGLEKKTSLGSEENSTLIDVYEGKGLVCTIEGITSSTSSNTASCGRLDAYPAAAALVQPFANALPSSHKGGDSLYLAVSEITKSSVEGYQRAEIIESSVEGSGGAAALFWKKDNGTWNYFTGAQNALSCAEFNTADLRNAFKDEPCYDETTEQLVTVQ